MRRRLVVDDAHDHAGDDARRSRRCGTAANSPTTLVSSVSVAISPASAAFTPILDREADRAGARFERGTAALVSDASAVAASMAVANGSPTTSVTLADDAVGERQHDRAGRPVGQDVVGRVTELGRPGRSTRRRDRADRSSARATTAATSATGMFEISAIRCPGSRRRSRSRAACPAVRRRRRNSARRRP